MQPHIRMAHKCLCLPAVTAPVGISEIVDRGPEYWADSEPVLAREGFFEERPVSRDERAGTDKLEDRLMLEPHPQIIRAQPDDAGRQELWKLIQKCRIQSCPRHPQLFAVRDLQGKRFKRRTRG